MPPGSSPLRLLVAGGGVAAVEALLAVRNHAGDRVTIDLLAPNLELEYRPRAVFEPFRLGERRRYPLGAIVRACDATHHRGSLESVDPAAGVVRTSDDRELGYDALLVATGARAEPPPQGMIGFSDEDPDRFARVLAELREGAVRRLAFVVPRGPAWPLPLYELALMSSYATQPREAPGLSLTIITPEDEPLAVFGRAAASAVSKLLAERAIDVRVASYVSDVESPDDGAELVLRPGGGRLGADRVITLPRLTGPAIQGLPADENGFIPVDGNARVLGAEGCFAAGDATTFPVKQGGIATQQADAAAEAIAAAAGADLEPAEFRPVLRGLLVTSAEPRFLRAAITGGQGETSVASSHLLWWPSTKIAGKFLAPHLARVDASTDAAIDPEQPGVLPIDVELADF